jgi:rare lipoprotein A
MLGRQKKVAMAPPGSHSSAGWPISIGAALWITGCSAYSSPNVRPAPITASEPGARAASSAARGNVTLASWYGPGFVGQRTASGEVYHRDDLTAASRSLPLGTRVRVTNLNTDRSVVVRINDRGPYVHGRGIDLSQHAAEQIGLNHSGVARVSITRLDQPATASASSMTATPEEWSGNARVTRHAPRHHRHSLHNYRHHYQYPSVSDHAQPRMAANPVGDWLLQMIR